MPHLDAKVGWAVKRAAPRAYTQALGLLERLGPLNPGAPMHHTTVEGR
jgi:hypothetical protein